MILKTLSRVEILVTIRVQRRRVKAHRFANVVECERMKRETFENTDGTLWCYFPFYGGKKPVKNIQYKKVSFCQIKMRYVE